MAAKFPLTGARVRVVFGYERWGSQPHRDVEGVVEGLAMIDYAYADGPTPAVEVRLDDGRRILAEADQVLILPQPRR
jgi:hypothetical protein